MIESKGLLSGSVVYAHHGENLERRELLPFPNRLPPTSSNPRAASLLLPIPASHPASQPQVRQCGGAAVEDAAVAGGSSRKRRCRRARTEEDRAVESGGSASLETRRTWIRGGVFAAEASGAFPSMSPTGG